MKTETTYTRRIVGVIKEDPIADDGMTVIISYSFTEDKSGTQIVYELGVYGAYPNMLRMLYLGGPLSFENQLTAAIREIDGNNIVFTNQTVTIL